MLKKFRIRLNDKEYIVEMEDLNPEVQFSSSTAQTVAETNPTPAVSQETSDNAVTENTESAPSSTKGEGEEITAPMPGTILAVHVQEGDQVSENQAVVVLEAMKMENQIVSPVDGTVTSILVQKGQTVDVGAVLFTVQ